MKINDILSLHSRYFRGMLAAMEAIVIEKLSQTVTLQLNDREFSELEAVARLGDTTVETVIAKLMAAGLAATQDDKTEGPPAKVVDGSPMGEAIMLTVYVTREPADR